MGSVWVPSGSKASKQQIGSVHCSDRVRKSNSLLASAVSMPLDRSVISPDRGKGKIKSHLTVVSVTEWLSRSCSRSFYLFPLAGEGTPKRCLGCLWVSSNTWPTNNLGSKDAALLAVLGGGERRDLHQVVGGISSAVPGGAGEKGHVVSEPQQATWGLNLRSCAYKHMPRPLSYFPWSLIFPSLPLTWASLANSY